MCIHFQQLIERKQYEHFYNVEIAGNFSEEKEVYPGRDANVIIFEKGKRVLKPMNWGLVPADSPDRKIAKFTYNARCESVEWKQSFKESFKSRRCLVPVTTFFEAQKIEGKRGDEFPFCLKNREFFALAGIWSEWQNPQGDLFDNLPQSTFSVITTPSNSLIQQLPKDRMAMVLEAEDESTWIDQNSNMQDIKQLCVPISGNKMMEN